MVQISKTNFINRRCNFGGQMLIMADHETVQVLVNTEIEKFTRIIKYFRLQNVIPGTNMT